MPAKPLLRTTLATQIAEQLRTDILSGSHAPGAQLQEASLALALGVSRGPLREAMQRLVQEGLLRSSPHRGVFVPEITERDVVDIFFVRGAVEAAAIRRITEGDRRHTTAQSLSRIADNMDRSIRSGDRVAGGEFDFDYHRTLVDAAASERLSRTYATVQAETRLCLHRLIDGYRSPLDLADEHWRLADMIATAPTEEVLAELQRHLGEPAATLRAAAKAADRRTV